MSSNEEYLGWTNRATWQIYHDIFDGMERRAWIDEENDEKVLADLIEEYVRELVFDDDDDGFKIDYAKAYLSQVNWYELALFGIWQKEQNSKG